MVPRLQKVLCQPTRSSSTLTRGASRAAPSPPAPQRIPVARPSRRRNQPLTAAISGTMQMDWVSDSSRLKVRRKCQGCRTSPSRTILPPYSTPHASIRHRAPYRSPNHPLTGEKSAPTT